MAKNELDDVWEFLDDVHTGWLTTRHGQQLHGRPMGVYVRRDDNAIYLLTNAASFKDDAVEEDPNVSLAFEKGTKYLSLTAEATVSNDRAKIKELWNNFAEAWWDGPEDPSIRLLTVTPHMAHYWKTAGKVPSAIAMFAASVTGKKKPDIGEQKDVRM
ncbi:MAG: pyridoxamine 5'-phosphate oxidase family protein [Caulobacterales bacterium]